MLDSIEIYDTIRESGWIDGPSLPKGLAEFSLITSPNGAGVVISGGISGSDRQTSIYELVCSGSGLGNDGCQWNQLEQKGVNWNKMK